MKRISIISIAIILCIILTAALTGCSGGKTATEADKTEAAQATEAAETVAETTAATEAEKTEAATEAETESEKSPLVGSWDYEELSGFVYTFNEDGTGKYDVFGEVMNFTYTDKGDSIEFHYEDVDAPTTLDYSIDGDTLTIKDSAGADVKYIKK